jgi:hypothetical protein
VFMAEFASKGVAGSGLGLGIAGTALGVLNGGLNGLGGLFGNNCGCAENQTINRYELGLESQIVSKDTEIALLKSNIYTDQKIADVYERLNTKIGGVEAAVNAQAVYNATMTGTIGCIQGQIAALQSLTKTIVPIDNVCPQPMPQYNSWTAPTA